MIESGRCPRRPERGQVLPLVAIVLSTLIIFASIAIDLGYQRLVRRDAQAVADVIALDLVRQTSGSTAADILTGSRRAAFASAIVESRNRNDHPADAGHRLNVEIGTIDAQRRFTCVASVLQEGTLPPSSPACGALPTSTLVSAVRVTTERTVDWFFRPGSGTTSRSAIASGSKSAGFSIGSFTAQLATTNSPLLNPILDGLLGANISSQIGGYRGLVDLDLPVDLLASGIGVSAGSATEVLGADVRLLRVLEVTADVLQQNGNLADANVLRLIALRLPTPNLTVDLGDALGVAAGSGEGALDGTVNVLQLVTTTLAIANGNNFVSVPGLNVNIPAITGAGPPISALTVDLGVIEGIQTLLGARVGDTITTQQVDLGIGGTVLGSIDLDAEVQVGRTTGAISDIRCSTAAAEDLDLALTPSLIGADVDLRLTLGELLSLRSIPAISAVLAPLVTLVNTSPLRFLIDLNAPILIQLTGAPTAASTYRVTFSSPPDVLVDEPVAQPPGLAAATQRTTPAGSIDLPQLRLVYAGFDPSYDPGLLGALTNTVLSLLTPILNTLVFNVLLTGVIDPLLGGILALLGLDVAGGSSWANSIDCAAPNLVG